MWTPPNAAVEPDSTLEELLGLPDQNSVDTAGAAEQYSAYGITGPGFFAQVPAPPVIRESVQLHSILSEATAEQLQTLQSILCNLSDRPDDITSTLITVGLRDYQLNLTAQAVQETIQLQYLTRQQTASHF
jgi:hypothetical protein